VVPFPDIGKAVAADGLLGALLEGVPLSGRIGLVGRGVAEHPAQVDEVLLGAGAFFGRAGRPLGGKLGGRHRDEDGTQWLDTATSSARWWRWRSAAAAGSRHSPRKTSPTRVDAALARFDVIGGTAPARVRDALAAAEGRLGLSATGG
jgi:hypothetical protein